MTTEPVIVAFIGWWELLLIAAVILIPATIIGVVLLVLYLSRRGRRTDTAPPQLPTNPRH